MIEQVALWAGLAALLALCLPIPAVRRLVLVVSAGVLRVALLAVVCGAGYLLVRPADLPTAVGDALAAAPQLAAVLPDPRTPAFGPAVAAILVGMGLPLVSALDVCWVMNRRVRRLEVQVEHRPDSVPLAEEIADTPAQPRRPTDRRAAAAAIAAAGR